MIKFVEYKRLRRYPHLLPVDAALWDRFIRFYPDVYEKVAYDVHLGEGVIPPLDLDVKLKGMVRLLTQKRMDVLGVMDGVLTIIELKSYAGTTAVGQLMTYRSLFQKQYADMPIPELLIITDQMQPDMDVVCRQFSIQIVEVGAVVLV